MRLIIKNRILSCCLYGLVLGANCSAQNWQPINSHDEYNYFTTPAFSSASIIKTESVGLNGSDSVFYLNRVVTSIPGNANHKLLRQGQFLGKMVIQRSNGLVTFMGNKDFTLNVTAGAGASWIFDTLRGSVATVLVVKYDTIFGQHDSLKVIGVSNYDTLVLSKQYGLISFRDSSSSQIYSLKGIQSRNLGYHVPEYGNIYNFNIGDVFEYRKHYTAYEYSTGVDESDYLHWKLTITSKTINGNQLSYVANKIESDTLWNLSNSTHTTQHFSGIVQLTFTDTASNYLNGFNQQYILAGDTNCTSYGVPTGVNSVEKVLEYEYNTLFQTEMKSHRSEYLTPASGDTVSTDNYFTNDNHQTERQSSAQYGNGTGLVYYHFSFEYVPINSYTTDIWLEGCVKGGITYGHITADSILLSGVHEGVHLSHYLVYPSLLTGEDLLHINGSGIPCQVSIYNSEGRMILSTRLFNSGETETDLNPGTLAKGIYFIKLQDRSGVFFSTKFIKN